MTAWGSAAAVIAALRDDAAVEGERMRREAEAALKGRQAGIDTAASAEHDGHLGKVRRDLAEASSAAEWEDTAAAATDRDAWIDAVAAEGRRRLASDGGAASWLRARLTESVRAVPGPSAVVTVPAAHVPAASALREEIEAASGKQITIEAGTLAGGCVARTPDGRVTFDNSVEARERRARSEWRAAVARCYDAAVVATVTAP